VTDDLMKIGARIVETLRASYALKAEQQVKKGVAFLDRHKPGWWKAIRLRELDLEDGYCCVLGQTFESKVIDDETGFHAAERLLRLKVPEKYGFEIDDDDAGPNYDELQVAWWRLISERQKAAKARGRS
jgi:hypothetical protein